LVEALACGIPVVAARVGGVPEIITSADVGLMVEPDNPRAAAQAISQALARSWNGEELSRIAHRRSWDNVAADIIERIRAAG
ncbi:MAG: glycosyltransferase, partial [Candidatus Latescibacterota bacterium]